MPKILGVDDSETMRKIIVRGLQDAGFSDAEFIEAADGAAGLDALSKDEIDLVLSDINMPIMNGIQFVRAIRAGATEVRQDVPIVMVTTESTAERLSEARSAGANDCLRKPFTTEQLAEKVRPFMG
jgi:two-component system chemotaxis response regulator CheY